MLKLGGTAAGDKRRVKPTLKNHENVAAQYPVTPTTSFSLVYIHKSFRTVKNELMIHTQTRRVEHIKMHVYTESHLAMMNTENS